MNATASPPTEAFDYVIVGGGSAGCVLAGRLSEHPGTTVCLLEAGPPDSSALVQCPAGLAVLAKTGAANWRFATEPQPGLNGRRGYQPRGRVLGGSSSVNAMVYVRGQPADYDAWAAMGNPGWGWRDLLPCFLRAEDNARGADAHHATGGPLSVVDLPAPQQASRDFVAAGVQAGYLANNDFNGATQEGVGIYQVTHRSGERFNAAKAYLAPHRARANLVVRTNAAAAQVLLDDNRRATGVLLQDGRTVHARREVLLCAGALQSPQLLMLSGIGPGAQLQRFGITVRHDAPGVGAHLHDHLDVVQVWDVPALPELFGLSAGGIARAARAAAQWRRDRSGPLVTNFAEAGGFIRSAPDLAAPDLQLHFVVGKLVDHGRATVWGHGYSCHVCLLQPQSRGSVALASPDPRAAPAIDPGFLTHPDDLPVLVRGFSLMRRILQQPALARHGGRERSAAVVGDAAIADFIRAHADTIYHPVGSCRMGPADTDPLDAELRVRGVQGLRVVDASAMPRIVSGNTNAPVIAMAEKAADLLRKSSQIGR